MLKKNLIFFIFFVSVVFAQDPESKQVNFLDDPTVPLRTVAENNLAIAFLTKTPIVPGHVLVCPKRMVSKSMELSFDEWKAILELKTIICSQLKNVFNAEGFNFAWNEGKNAGQSVPHFHLHILPRKEGDAGVYQYEPRVFLYRPGTRATSPQEELSSLANMLRKNSIKVRK